MHESEMFGRRRRTPLLTAAVIAGTASAASRHGARKQSEMEAQRQFQMEQEAEFRRNQQDRERMRNQQAIDAAVNEALAKQQANQGIQQAPAPPIVMQPAVGAPAPIVMQPAVGPPPPLYASRDEYMASGPGPYLEPGAAPPRPRSTGAVDSGICFCHGCGSKCGMQDRFCSRCGQSLAGIALDNSQKQAM